LEYGLANVFLFDFNGGQAGKTIFGVFDFLAGKNILGVFGFMAARLPTLH
jgi:hypothetical protein